MNFKNPFAKILGMVSEKISRTDVYCDEDQPDHVQLECGIERGGIVALAFISPDVDVDEDDIENNLEDADWWDNLITNSPQGAWVVLNTRGTKPQGTPTEEEGYGLVPMETTGDDHELTFESLGVMQNRTFWGSKNRRRNWKMVYLTAGTNDDGNYEAFYVKNVSVYASTTIEQSVKSRKRYGGRAKWSTDLTPDLPFHAPSGIFLLNE